MIFIYHTCSVLAPSINKLDKITKLVKKTPGGMEKVSNKLVVQKLFRSVMGNNTCEIPLHEFI